MNLFDTHAHLNDEAYDTDDEMIQRARRRDRLL